MGRLEESIVKLPYCTIDVQCSGLCYISDSLAPIELQFNGKSLRLWIKVHGKEGKELNPFELLGILMKAMKVKSFYVLMGAVKRLSSGSAIWCRLSTIESVAE